MLRNGCYSCFASTRRFAALRTFLRYCTSNATFGPAFSSIFAAKHFDYAAEEDIYKWWESKGYFQPQNSGKPKYTISMPPPNVTGHLHMGHALIVTLQDILIRYHRMKGFDTLWLPGTDHAGIATQQIVEKHLASQQLQKSSMTRQEFVNHVWNWKHEKGGRIIAQTRRLGASADWSRERFTLDESMCTAVTEAFLQLHKKGYIYRDNVIINWCPQLLTAVSDLEVEYSDEVGHLYTVKYLLEGHEKYIPVATTRPETILGDVAVCVHPEDVRYQEFIGKHVYVPVINRRIPVIADSYVDRDFGTGALKITPAHDSNDYKIGKKHNLEFINIMNPNATLNEEAGPYTGLDRYECRHKIWDDIMKLNLGSKSFIIVDGISKVQHSQRVPRSQRSGAVIEPRLSSQWFIRMNAMADKALSAVQQQRITIVPDRFEKEFCHWMTNIHDWCVSRQLWWGHQIPVYYIVGSSEYVVARNHKEALEVARERFGDAVEIKQDEDVLDTWFSSGLWPFATLGWPHATSDYARFYPTSVLETGYDILFFWVARMIMLGIELTGEPPFHTVYLHGLIRDAHGQKMSKSKGNVIDPIDVVATSGCDALRFALCFSATANQDIPLSMERVEVARTFVNKLWNMGKYAQYATSALPQSQLLQSIDFSTLPITEKYILSKLHLTAMEVDKAMHQYAFAEIARLMYDFSWNEFADWYVEANKTRSASDNRHIASRWCLIYCLDMMYRLLHPIMPHVTEVLWQNLPRSNSGDSIMVSTWPVENKNSLFVDDFAIGLFERTQRMIKAVRNARAEYNVDVTKKIAAVIYSTDEKYLSYLKDEAPVLSLLGRVEASQLTFVSAAHRKPNLEEYIHLVIDEGCEVYLPRSDMIDAARERVNYSRKLTQLTQEIAKLDKQLSSSGFLTKAPEAVVAEIRKNREERVLQRAAIEEKLELLIKT